MFDFLDQFTPSELESTSEVVSTDGGTATPTPAETGGPAPTAPAPSTSPEAQREAPAGGQTPGRTFTQIDLDNIVRERVARADRAAQEKYNQQLARAQQEWEQTLQAIARQQSQQGADGAYRDPPNPLESRIEAQDRVLNELMLDRNLNNMAAKYPDFRENENAILQTALDLGTMNLDLAYRNWAYDKLTQAQTPKQVDEEAIGKAAVERYLAEKRGDNARTPQPEGRGGSTPVAGTKKIKTFDDADKAAAEMLKRMDRT